MDQLAPAIVGAATALILAVVTHQLGLRQERRRQLEEERHTVNLKYLNPLRLTVVENYSRLLEILRTVANERRCAPLTFIRNPSQLRRRSTSWYNNEGAYLSSSCYLAACLFATMSRIRRDIPFLRLAAGDDTELLVRMRRVSLGYLRELGVFYATQDTIGRLVDPEGSLMTYGEFTDLIRSRRSGVWTDWLVRYYLETGRAEKMIRIGETLTAMESLMQFLDDAIGGGSYMAAIQGSGRPTKDDL